MIDYWLLKTIEDKTKQEEVRVVRGIRRFKIDKREIFRGCYDCGSFDEQMNWNKLKDERLKEAFELGLIATKNGNNPNWKGYDEWVFTELGKATLEDAKKNNNLNLPWVPLDER